MEGQGTDLVQRSGDGGTSVHRRHGWPQAERAGIALIHTVG
jgi:hypothetical protein